MKALSFIIGDSSSYGILEDGVVHEPDDAFRGVYPSLRAVLSSGELAAFANACKASGRNHSLDGVTCLPVIPDADKVLCVGVNYLPHIREMGRDVPDYPVVFMRVSDSHTGHGQPILRPRVSEEFDFEGELAVIIGKTARHVSKEDALTVVAGYCCFMDGSVRDWQKHTAQFTAGKNFHRSGAFGPCLVTADEIPDPSALSLTTRVNGEVMQQGRLSDLVFSIPTLIEYCSTFTELLPGDVIATGTPGGVGAARKPPKWLKAGDLVEVEIPGVGCLNSPVIDE